MSRRPRRLPLVIGLLLAGGLASACFVHDDDGCEGIACGPAGPPLTVRVPGVTDAVVVVLRQDGAAVETVCESSATETYCMSNAQAGDTQAGVYLVHVEAPGYQDADVAVVVAATAPGGCCNPGYVEETVTVELTP